MVHSKVNYIPLAQSVIIVLNRKGSLSDEIFQNIAFNETYPKKICRNENGSLCVLFTERKKLRTNVIPFQKQAGYVMTGDVSEKAVSTSIDFMANATSIEFDLDKEIIMVRSSIVGLPPLYIYQGSECTIVTSDLYLLSSIPGISWKFNTKAVMELGRIGFPIEGKTLIDRVNMLPPASQLEIDTSGNIITRNRWEIPLEPPISDWEEFLEMQVSAFRSSFNMIDTKDTFLSLTAGLDTRAILACSMDQGTILPCATITGKNLSLDAKTACRLTDELGLQHHLVHLNEEFSAASIDYIRSASRLSGGIASISQAHEVYFNHATAGLGSGRLSGNLGNQLGRGGMENISLRDADPEILAQTMLEDVEIETSHWYNDTMLIDGQVDFNFLLFDEIPYSSVGNYSIGNHHKIQKTPYADRGLIEVTVRKPIKSNRVQKMSLLKIRILDLKHRFLGLNRERSFQVRLISNIGGPSATLPINWGWMVGGGISLKGTALGSVALLDALISSKIPNKRLLRKLSATMRVLGTHDYLRFHEWIFTLREFCYDTILSKATAESGMLHQENLLKTMDLYFDYGKGKFETIMFAMDIALARENLRLTI